MSYVEYKRRRRARQDQEDRERKAAGGGYLAPRASITSLRSDMSARERPQSQESGVDLIKRGLSIFPTNAAVNNVFVVMGASVSL